MSTDSFRCLVCNVKISDDTPEGHAAKHREQIKSLTLRAESGREVKPMGIATLDRFVDWLVDLVEDEKEAPTEDLRGYIRTTMMYSFNPPRLDEIGWFRSERERYLRREVVDKFLRGDVVNVEDLREAVYDLCVFLGQAADIVAMEKRRREERRHTPYPPRRGTRSTSG